MSLYAGEEVQLLQQDNPVSVPEFGSQPSATSAT